MTALRVTTIGDETAVVLTPELALRLNAVGGGEVMVIETPTGAILQSVDPQTARQIEIAAGVMDRRSDALKRLAE